MPLIFHVRHLFKRSQPPTWDCGVVVELHLRYLWDLGIDWYSFLEAMVFLTRG